MSECIIGSGSPNNSGYIYQYYSPTGRMEGVHRIAYMRTHGLIPAGLVVMHICNNRKCINIEHLKLGTHKDNFEHMVRERRGPAQVLSLGEHDEIRIAYATGQYTQRQLADLYGVSKSQVSNIVRGKTTSRKDRG